MPAAPRAGLKTATRASASSRFTIAVLTTRGSIERSSACVSAHGSRISTARCCMAQPTLLGASGTHAAFMLAAADGCNAVLARLLAHSLG